MWDLKTIKDINSEKPRSKLWKHLAAWKKFCITRNQKK